MFKSRLRILENTGNSVLDIEHIWSICKLLYSQKFNAIDDIFLLRIALATNWNHWKGFNMWGYQWRVCSSHFECRTCFWVWISDWTTQRPRLRSLSDQAHNWLRKLCRNASASRTGVDGFDNPTETTKRARLCILFWRIHFRYIYQVLRLFFIEILRVYAQNKNSRKFSKNTHKMSNSVSIFVSKLALVSFDT